MLINRDPLLARAMERVLRGKYDVVVATTARMAIKALDGGSGRDLILCEVDLPNGIEREVFQVLSHSDPDLAKKILFLEGVETSSVTRRFLERLSPERCRSMPADVESLRILVSDGLDEASSRDRPTRPRR